MMDIAAVQKKFHEIYGGEGDIRSYHAPGRVNLIGEHTDYNGGAVFPCALSFGTLGCARKREDGKLNFASANFDSRISCGINDLAYQKEHDWANYLKGVMVEFQKLGYPLGGMDILIAGNIPNASGLSSSASIELLMSVMCDDLFACGMDRVEMVKLCQRVENHYIGVNSGIMDQFAIGMGRKDQAILLYCDTLKYEYVPAEFGGNVLVIANTNKRRGLADSKYNERRAECDRAVADLQKELPIKLLADVTPEQFEAHKHLITEPVVLKRATHVIYEIQRTLDAVKALQANDLALFGQLLNQSHDSLRDLYEVTGIELDTLVEEARKVEGVWGARMTGAGFGGCAISLVKASAVEAFQKAVGEAYTQKIGYAPSFYIAETGDGAGRL